MPSDSILLFAILLLAFAVYYPIVKIARKDMDSRSLAGMSNTPILMFLMLPIIGPLLYILIRKNFLPK